MDKYKAADIINRLSEDIYKKFLANNLVTDRQSGLFTIEGPKIVGFRIYPTIKIRCNPHPCFTFFTGDIEDAVEKGLLIKENIHKGNIKKKYKRDCCSLAEHPFCVCEFNYNCVLHGQKHIGTHE